MSSDSNKINVNQPLLISFFDGEVKVEFKSFSRLAKSDVMLLMCSCARQFGIEEPCYTKNDRVAEILNSKPEYMYAGAGKKGEE